jgi:hypothetical protein
MKRDPDPLGRASTPKRGGHRRRADPGIPMPWQDPCSRAQLRLLALQRASQRCVRINGGFSRCGPGLGGRVTVPPNDAPRRWASGAHIAGRGSGSTVAWRTSPLCTWSVHGTPITSPVVPLQTHATMPGLVRLHEHVSSRKRAARALCAPPTEGAGAQRHVRTLRRRRWLYVSRSVPLRHDAYASAREISRGYRLSGVARHQTCTHKP